MERAEKYRERAEELRTIAQDWIDSRAQETLIQLAKDYERMAEELEGRALPQRADK